MKIFIGLVVFITSLITPNILLSQNINLGFTGGYSLNYFEHSNSDYLTQNNLTTYKTPTYGLGVVTNFQVTNGFSLSMLATYMPKNIRIVRMYYNSFFNKTFFYVKHESIAVDFSIRGEYIMKRKYFTIIPFLGFTLSRGKYFDVAIGVAGNNNVSGNNTSGSLILSPINIEYNEKQFTIPFVSIGAKFSPLEKIKKELDIEMFFLFNYSPRNIFSIPFSYKIDTGVLTFEDNLQGRLHYIQIGFNYYLKRL